MLLVAFYPQNRLPSPPDPWMTAPSTQIDTNESHLARGSSVCLFYFCLEREDARVQWEGEGQRERMLLFKKFFLAFTFLFIYFNLIFLNLHPN